MSLPKNNFKKAMHTTILLCKAWEDGSISDEVLSDRVLELLETIEGARGFFVISLSNDCPLMDRLPSPLVIALRIQGEMIVDLLVKNLAMSTAMAISHGENKESIQKETSLRISQRCKEILRLMDSKQVKERLERLVFATDGKGSDVTFIKRWNYNKQQIEAIRDSAFDVAKN